MDLSKLKIQESECACVICSYMCRAPCCGTPSEMKDLIDSGYANRLSFEGLDAVPCIMPSLKGNEGENVPYRNFSSVGCTFWRHGLCELHDLKKKPIAGRYAHHSQNINDADELCEILDEMWKSDEGKQVIRLWKKIRRKRKLLKTWKYEQKDFTPDPKNFYCIFTEKNEDNTCGSKENH